MDESRQLTAKSDWDAQQTLGTAESGGWTSEGEAVESPVFPKALSKNLNPMLLLERFPIYKNLNPLESWSVGFLSLVSSNTLKKFVAKTTGVAWLPWTTLKKFVAKPQSFGFERLARVLPRLPKTAREPSKAEETGSTDGPITQSLRQESVDGPKVYRSPVGR